MYQATVKEKKFVCYVVVAIYSNEMDFHFPLKKETLARRALLCNNNGQGNQLADAFDLTKFPFYNEIDEIGRLKNGRVSQLLKWDTYLITWHNGAKNVALRSPPTNEWVCSWLVGTNILHVEMKWIYY